MYRCEIKRDQKSGDSLCYCFVEFEDVKACEEAYFKMENVSKNEEFCIKNEEWLI